ncbi:MAG: ribbon-helix-helix protein, CopG family [Actinomycetota bacterium]|nr:ribbon-helix-helix protein, CopG family [Actinomycetota bacterium]
MVEEKRNNGGATRTVSIDFSEEAYEALERLAEEKGVSMAEVLRDAISLEQWIEQLRKDKDARLLIEREGERRELVLD